MGDTVEKCLSNSDLGGSKELSPGEVGRRFEPECGVKKHNERIHRESAYADSHLNLPFSFSKPKKFGRREIKKCSKCGKRIYTSINTVGFICKNCGKFVIAERTIIDDR